MASPDWFFLEILDQKWSSFEHEASNKQLKDFRRKLFEAAKVISFANDKRIASFLDCLNCSRLASIERVTPPAKTSNVLLKRIGSEVVACIMRLS